MLYPLRGQLTCKTHSQDNTLEQTAHVILTILLTIWKKKKKPVGQNHGYTDDGKTWLRMTRKWEDQNTHLVLGMSVCKPLTWEYVSTQIIAMTIWEASLLTAWPMYKHSHYIVYLHLNTVNVNKKKVIRFQHSPINLDTVNNKTLTHQSRHCQ